MIAKSGPITLARVPGGVARRVSPEALMMIQEVTWSPDSRTVLYAAAPELTLGKIMRASSGSTNPFDVQGNNQRVQREMMQMMAPQLHFYDLQRGVAGRLQTTWAPNLRPMGRMRLSPDGKYLALVLVDYGQISTVEEQFEAEGELHVAPVGPDMKLGQPVRLAPASQFHWLPDSQGLLYLQGLGGEVRHLPSEGALEQAAAAQHPPGGLHGAIHLAGPEDGLLHDRHQGAQPDRSVVDTAAP